MALSDDQKALLRLLAQREEGYEDIAALLGLSVAEVRARVKGALAELETGAPSSPPREERPRRAAPSPAPAPPPAPRRQEARPTRRAPLRLPSLPKERGRRLEIVGGVLVIALIALFATGAIDIGDDDGGSDSASSANAANGKITQAVLEPPQGGGDAVGRAIFGRVGKGPVLQVVAEGLEPTRKGESYTVWLYRSPKLALRLGSIPVGKSGGLGAQLPLPAELFAYLAGGAFNQIYVSRTDDSEYAAEVADAKRDKRLPAYTGTTVLRGEIVGPLVRG